MIVKEMCDFNPKNVTIGSGIEQNKNRHLFDPMVRNPSFSRGNCSLSFKTLISHVKWAFFNQWVKKMAIFLGLKNYTFPEDAFFNSLSKL